MSGGFFRGTSADQDTRFSNKQAKLLKSQKFAPELDHLVDMTKVKMDVMRPWIATRTTELLGFEDEVLINFIYGLLEQKVVDGKKIQIQLTGFMEKNTVKFMKELWSLLLSAQQNASGVPQQFLDAKEEEMRKKKAETDRITQEIQKRKDRDGRDREREKQNMMDVEPDNLRHANFTFDLAIEHSSKRAPSIQTKEDGEGDKQNDIRMGKHPVSPQLNNRSRSPMRKTYSHSRSSSKSFSRSRSYSRERRISRSISVSSQSRKRSLSPALRRRTHKRLSISPDLRYRSTHWRSISPRRRHSPPGRRRSPYTRRRSTSRAQHRSPSPVQRRSPYARQRSPLSFRRRSPAKDRSLSPRHRSSPPRRSPAKNKSLSPPRRRRTPPRRSHIENKSLSPPSRRRTSPRMPDIEESLTPPRHRRTPPRKPPIKKKSLSPRRCWRTPPHRSLIKEKSISPPRRRRTPSHRSPVAGRSSSFKRCRSPTPSRRSPTPIKKRPLSPVRGRGRSPSPYRSPLDNSPIKRRPSSVRGSSSSPLRRSPRHRSSEHQRTSPHCSPKKDRVESQILMQQRNRSHSPYGSQSPSNQTSRSSCRDPDQCVNGTARFQDGYVAERSRKKKSPIHPSVGKSGSKNSGFRQKDSDSIAHQISAKLAQTDAYEDDVGLEENSPDQLESPSIVPKKVTKGNRSHSLSESPAKQQKEKKPRRDSPEARKEENQLNNFRDAVERKIRNSSTSPEEREYGPGVIGKGLQSSDSKNKKRVYHNNKKDSSSEEVETQNHNSKKQRHKKPYDPKNDSGDVDSEMDSWKEAKRKKKDERRQRREERRRRREERHQRKKERRLAKLAVKPTDDASPSSDHENKDAAHEIDDLDNKGRDSYSSDSDGTKKLEIELRKKALESLRAKKSTN